jgi:hypothetical protein
VIDVQFRIELFVLWNRISIVEGCLIRDMITKYALLEQEVSTVVPIKRSFSFDTVSHRVTLQELGLDVLCF